MLVHDHDTSEWARETYVNVKQFRRATCTTDVHRMEALEYS